MRVCVCVRVAVCVRVCARIVCEAVCQDCASTKYLLPVVKRSCEIQGLCERRLRRVQPVPYAC